MIDLPFSIDPFQGPAMVLGMAGALLVASPVVRTRRIGFGCWIVGNALWVATGVLGGNPYVTVMFGFYWVTAVCGWRNNALMCDVPGE